MTTTQKSKVNEHVMFMNPPRPTLTKRQREALTLASHGLSYEGAAKEMGLTAGAIKRLLGGACQRLNARTVPHAVIIALRYQLID